MFVVDDQEQCTKGGTLRSLIRNGVLARSDVHIEIGEVCCGRKPGRMNESEGITFWNRGLVLSDIVLWHRIHARALKERRG